MKKSKKDGWVGTRTHIVFCALFAILLFGLITRSAIHTKRVLAELFSKQPEEQFYPNIQKCSAKLDNFTREQLQLWEYRNLETFYGEPCE